MSNIDIITDNNESISEDLVSIMSPGSDINYNKDSLNKTSIINATNGIISNNFNSEINDNDNNTIKLKTIAVNNNTIDNMLNKYDDIPINGWDKDANATISNWYKLFKSQSFVYQYILDRNRKICDWLGILSIITSSFMGVFIALKLWLDNNIIFQITSNIILIIMNFIVALMTGISKRYIDDKRNDELREYINQVDILLGEISAQILLHPIYRNEAKDFFRINNDRYTKLVSSAPNLSILELKWGIKQYEKYISNTNHHSFSIIHSKRNIDIQTDIV
jgi:hypothetical protein